METKHDGFILVVCMLILVVLSIIGIATVKNTTVELQSAGNDNLNKKTLYGAEASVMLGAELLEQNISCAAGFSGSGAYIDLGTAGTPNVRVYSDPTNNLAFYFNPFPWTDTECNITDLNAPTISYPTENLVSQVELSDIYIGGVIGMLPGGSLEMAAGYEGKGKGAASGGSARFYDIIAVNKDVRNAENVVLFGWRHLVGDEGECSY